MKEIYIRVDGNDCIATGHVMRCLSIAEQLRLQGASVTFLTADDYPIELIHRHNFSTIILHTTWNRLDEETEVLCSLIQKHQIRQLLIDSYYVTIDYLTELSKHTEVAYIDDIYQFPYPVHTLINYSIFATEQSYRKLYKGTDRLPHLLCGSSYVPLRAEFACQSYEVRPTAKNILITTGGTDSYNISGKLLEQALHLPEFASIEFQVIVGIFNQHKKMLTALSKKHPQIHLHENVSNMAHWMRLCDAAVSASGSTLYELCACGTPSICLSIAENQNGAERWQEHQLMSYAGNAAENLQGCIRQCILYLQEYIQDPELRRRLSKNARAIIDGRGAGRIAAYLCSYI